MSKRKLILLLVLAAMLCLTGCDAQKTFLPGLNFAYDAFNTETGTYDLSVISTKQHTVVPMYAAKPVSVGSIEKLSRNIDEDGYLTFPITWFDTFKPGSTDTEVYEFHMKLYPNDEGVYAIMIPAITCAFELRLNDNVIYSNGYDGAKQYYPHPVVVTFSSKMEEYKNAHGDYTLTLTLRHSTIGAQSIPSTFYVGELSSLNTYQGYYLLAFFFIISICFLTMIYQMIFFFNRNKSRTNIAFAMIVFFAGNAISFMGDAPIAYMFPKIVETAGRRCFSCSLNLLAASILLYFLFLTKRSISQKRKRSLYILFIGVAVFLCILPPMYVYVGQCVLAILFVLIALWLLFFGSEYLGNDKRELIRVRLTILAFVVLCFTIALILVVGLDQHHSYMFPHVTVLIIFLHYLLESLEYQQRLKHVRRISSNIQDTIHSIDNYETALSSTQMKPEFVYKTFDIITDMCDKNRETAEDMTLALAKYMRMTLDYSRLSGLVTLQNEIDLVKAYVNIERHAHENITVEYFMPTTLPEVMVPPMTIMPLVENAFQYAFPKERPGKIMVSVVSDAKIITITVTDDGVGIPEEIMDTITEFKGHTTIGINHIDYTLKRTYGKGLVFRTSKESGTSISFTVPGNFIGREVPKK